VSKKELGKVFRIFFNLRHGGSALIDQRPKQAIPAIKGLEYIESITVLQLFFRRNQK
jgi:hypothetical protein